MKSTIAFLAVLCAGVVPQACAQATPQTCMGAFLAMGFEFRNYAKYNDYFHNESTVQLAQAGVYTGPAAIMEYVKFAMPENPSIASVATVNQTFALTGLGADTCEFFTISYSHYGFTELFSNGTLNVVAAFRMYLNITSGKFDRLNVYYDTDYLRWYGGMTAFPAYQAWLCTSMENDCPNTWSFNNLSSQADCVDRLAALPTTTGAAASYDGNSQACRSLHGMLAGLNPDQHCPHISFAPQEDPNGAIKCQTSKNVDATDLFTAQQLGLLALFKIENAIPPSGYFASIPCESDDVICPLDHVCVAGSCVAPGDMTADNQTNTTGNASDDNSTTSSTSSTSSATTADDSDSDAASSMHMCTGVFFLLLAALGRTSF